MKFSELEYERPNYEEVKRNLEVELCKLESSSHEDDFITVFDKINHIRSHVQTMATLCSVRNSIDTSDAFYDEENNYWDEIQPLYQELTNTLYKITLSKDFRDELLNTIPSAFFKLAECATKSFDARIIPLMQVENKLVSRKMKLYSTAKIEFDGQVYNLSSIGKKLVDIDRQVREDATLAKMAWFEANESEIDEIFDQLIKVRTTMANELGFDSFVELGYLRMSRLDYDATMVKTYREQVLRYVVPAAKKLFDDQCKALGYEKLAYFDCDNVFSTGNPTPKGTMEELLSSANKMYCEMSKETGEFFKCMIDNELFDLKSKENKQGGGYCTDLLDFKLPFIFSNFNGTSGDVDVLTHEAGHAFQSYLSMKTITIPECMFPTMESAEIHSMSMEFFAHPWMNYFFKEDTDKYYYSHVASAIKFIPYGVLVDHFQHEIYAHPNCSKNERKEIWKKLEKMYLPYKDYTGCDLLEKGCWWYQQGHIFQTPFYYIDYTLAQVCALQFWKRNMDKDPEAWHDYVRICKIGGTKTFLEIVASAGLKSPFEEGTLEPVIKTVIDYLDQFDLVSL